MAPKILISINAAWNIANFRSGLVRSMQEAGYEVVAAAPPDEHVPRVLELGVRFVPVPMDGKGVNPLKDLMLFLRYIAVLRRERPAVYVSFTVKPNVYGGLAAGWLRIPSISNVAGLGTPFVRDSLLTRIVEILYRAAFSRSRKVFFQNNEDMALFLARRLVRRDIAERLPGSGVDTEYFSPEKLDVGRHPGPVRFLLLARLLWAKGVGEFVDAARMLRAEGVEAEFCLMGFVGPPNPTAISLKQVAEWHREGVIKYLGEMVDVRPAIQNADCVVLPSYYREGVPRSLLEAASLGRAIITTDHVGCRDAVDDGVTGLLCRPRDARDLAVKMRSIVAMTEQERAELGRQGRAKMIREFDERIVTNKYLEATEGILSLRAYR